MQAVAAFVLLAALLLPTAPADARALDADGASSARQATAPADSLYFPETGFAIDEPRFVEYFTRRGQVPTFGFPISRTIRFQGLPTQFFQRIVVQLGPDGSVRPLNLLDPGLLPYTRINGSTFPAPNERLAALAPAPDQPGYAREVLEFVRRNAPETFNGQPVRFFSTFSDTVTASTAFPRGVGDASLLPLINLEIWGVPTSLPAVDPNNGGFIYQRFQRGIMHYDAACRCTQGLLLADYFKALLTGENIPSDLAAQAQGSPFLRQYAADRPAGLARLAALPNTDLTDAFTRQTASTVTARAPAPAPAAVVPSPATIASSSPSTTVTAPAVAGGPPGAPTQPIPYRLRLRASEAVWPAIDALESASLTAPLQAVYDSDTELSFGTLPESVHARYSRVGTSRGGAVRTIMVSPRWQGSDPKAIATLIVHEATHLADDLAGTDPRTTESCYQFEIRAFTQQATAWQTFYGQNGKAQPRDELELELNAWVGVYRRGPDELAKRVRELYAEACSRPGPRPH
jgi:hypothetical protein